MFLKSFWGGKTLYILSHRISADTKMKNEKGPTRFIFLFQLFLGDTRDKVFLN